VGGYPPQPPKSNMTAPHQRGDPQKQTLRMYGYTPRASICVVSCMACRGYGNTPPHIVLAVSRVDGEPQYHALYNGYYVGAIHELPLRAVFCVWVPKGAKGTDFLRFCVVVCWWGAECDAYLVRNVVRRMYGRMIIRPYGFLWGCGGHPHPNQKT